MSRLPAVRVRFAPSPTGQLHIGGLRTALFNSLFARQSNGSMILRIEDTDQKRTVDGAVENLQKMLTWAGIDIDEGPFSAGADSNAYGPFTQSERLDLYRDRAYELVDRGFAYPCFCTESRLNVMRHTQRSKGMGSTKYDRTCLGLDKNEFQTRIDAGEPHTIRMIIPRGDTVVQDAVLGNVKFDHGTIDDQILLKTDGFPTYHLANVVDDHSMDITHVIRGEEWLPSTPKHLLLYKWFEWDAPVFAHLPLLLNTKRAKLSKRHGDVSVEDFVDKGYLPDALCNFVALLGWNPGDGDTQEVFLPDELLSKFSMGGINAGGAVVDTKKLDHLNREHIKRLCSGSSGDKKFLRKSSLPFLTKHIGRDAEHLGDDEYVERVLSVLQDRVHTLDDFGKYGAYFFKEPELVGNEDLELEKDNIDLEHWNGTAKPLVLDGLWKVPESEFQAGNVQKALKGICKENKIGFKAVFKPLRLQLTGMKDGAALPEIIELLGKNVCIERLEGAKLV